VDRELCERGACGEFHVGYFIFVFSYAISLDGGIFVPIVY